jgi:hypothetical protein
MRPSPPRWNAEKQTLDFRIASPHLNQDGSVAEGFYNLSVSQEVANCLWGGDVSKSKAEVSIISDAGEKKIFRDSLLDNAVELCGLLTKLNITNDPKLEEARKLLESTVCNVDVKDLRTSTGARSEIKAQVDEILNKFNW